jgi:hypothetical protein
MNPEMLGWLMWNTMRFMAALGLAVLGGSVVLLIWFMFDVGLAWVAVAVLVGALVLLGTFVRRLAEGPTADSAAGEIVE